MATDNAIVSSRQAPDIATDNGDGAATSAVQLLEVYSRQLDRAPLSVNTRRAYRSHAARFLRWLEQREEGASELSEPLSRDFAVRDYRRHLKATKLAAASVNSHLASVDHLCRVLGLGSPRVDRDRLPAQAPRALSDDELRAVIRASLRSGDPRDGAFVALMGLAGLRVSEVVALDVDDVSISARRGRVVVRRGKGDAGRDVPLSAEARGLLASWLDERGLAQPGAPLFTGPSGRLSTRAVDRAVRRLAGTARVELSPHVLRHTFVTRLIRSGTDVVLAAELAGHRSLETTRRYALPTREDRERAVDGVPIDA